MNEIYYGHFLTKIGKYLNPTSSSEIGWKGKNETSQATVPLTGSNTNNFPFSVSGELYLAQQTV